MEAGSRFGLKQLRCIAPKKRKKKKEKRKKKSN
jgi:hypothetical protein